LKPPGTEMRYTAFNFCFQIQLAPLNPGSARYVYVGSRLEQKGRVAAELADVKDPKARQGGVSWGCIRGEAHPGAHLVSASVME